MAGPPRVLYLAFDACDREVVRELAAAGDLPTFAHLFDTSAVAPVDPPHGVYISANWPSFTTALTPDHHQYCCWVEVDPATYAWEETSPRQARGVPFWHALADAGHRVAVFDVPHTLVSDQSSAVQITVKTVRQSAGTVGRGAVRACRVSRRRAWSGTRACPGVISTPPSIPAPSRPP